MTRQVIPEEIAAIRIGATIALIIVLFFSVWIIDFAVCDISNPKDKFGLLFAIFAVAGIVPWLYILVVRANFRRSSQKYSIKIKKGTQTLDTLITTLESLLNQLAASEEFESSDFQALVDELRQLIHDSAALQEMSKIRNQALEWLERRGVKKEIIREATEVGLQGFNKFNDLSRQEKDEVKKGFEEDIEEFIKWLIESLKLGEQNTENLKRGFQIESVTNPYTAALKYIKDTKLIQYCKSDLEIKEVSKYIDILINSL